MSVPVSVVMTVYNGRRWLAQQVESVLAQLQECDELVIVDDGSNDGSLELIRDMRSPHIRLYVNPRNLGVMRNFERGLRLARHDIIFLCDQDDIWLAGKRDAFVAAFQAAPQACIVVSDAELIDAQGAVLSKSYMASARGGFDGSVLGTVWRNRYLGCAMALRRSLLRVALPIPDSAPNHDIWIGAIGRSLWPTVYLPSAYHQYRRHDRNDSPMGGQSLWQMLAQRLSLVMLLLQRRLALLLGLHDDRPRAGMS